MLEYILEKLILLHTLKSGFEEIIELIFVILLVTKLKYVAAFWSSKFKTLENQNLFVNIVLTFLSMYLY